MKSPSILLRPVQESDAGALFPLIFQTLVTDTILWDGPDSLDQFQLSLAERAQQVKRGEKHIFTILELSTGQPVGTCSIRPDQTLFRADIGLWIGTPHQGKGFGTATITSLLDYGFLRLGLEKIEASVFVGNHASRRIFEKNGFQLEGIIRKAVRKRGVSTDEWLLGITREDWTSSADNQPKTRIAIDQMIVHICPLQDWLRANASGIYHAESLQTEGYIHASKPTQILGVANRFYGKAVELLVFWIDPRLVKAEIRWEAVDDDVFPHIYGEINLDAVISVRAFLTDPDGVFRQLNPP